MRIIAGKLKGRTFVSPDSPRTHPMSEKVRGALFNALGDITGLSMLDAFAGSGALGFEAVSRGAARATLVDIDKRAISTIVKSARALGVDEHIKAVRAGAGAWLETAQETFAIVLLDPPYDGGIRPGLLRELAGRAEPGGVVAVSLPPDADFSLPPEDFQLLAHKSYGDATLAFYRRIG